MPNIQGELRKGCGKRSGRSCKNRSRSEVGERCGKRRSRTTCESNKTVEPGVFGFFGFVDDTHTSTTQFFDDVVMRNGLAAERVGT